jgi:hypothetical protein
MRSQILAVALVLLCCAGAAQATSFVVPSDDELIAKSQVIVTGTIEGAYVEERDGMIQTVYELRVERSLKGEAHSSELLRFWSLGGVLGDRGLFVAGAPHFDQGDRVLMFLTSQKGILTPTDLTLGKFRFVVSTSGDRLLVRDMEDVVGWDRNGDLHTEQVRREEGFLRFISDRLRGRKAAADYVVDAAEVTLPPHEGPGRFRAQVNAPFPGATYTSWVNGQPTRWPNIAAGVTFRKRADQNISGVADGGVSVIQNGLAAWTNDCGSVINLIYGGTTPTPSANFDGISVVEFNDPQQRISGSWTGSGTIGICFNSFSNTHTFDGRTWWSISDADVVFQDGYPGTHPTFPTAMTHELGHGIGWRHSNQDYSTGGACNSSIEECTSAAIMNSSVNSGYGYTLQPWDINAARSVYPGGTCGGTCTPPAITGQPTSRTITRGASTTLTVTATGTAPVSYQWYTGTSGNTANPIAGATSSSLTVSPSSTTTYWVRVSNSCGTVNSATATVTVNVPPPPTSATRLRTDFDGDGKSDFFWRNLATGGNAVWFMNGPQRRSSGAVATIATSWTPVAFGDFNGDGRSDVFWHNTNGRNAMWLMNGFAIQELAAPSSAAGWSVVASGDFNGDGRFDLFWRNTATGGDQIWYMNGPNATIVTVATVGTAWQVLAAGDFDGDRRYDVFWRNSNGANVLWLMTATRTVEVAITGRSTPWTIFGSGDFNADGRDDVFWRNPTTGADVVWLMNGTAQTEVAFPTVATYWTPRLVGDFNGDGTSDLEWQNTSDSTAMWIINNARVTSETATGGNGSGWRLLGLN